MKAFILVIVLILVAVGVTYSLKNDEVDVVPENDIEMTNFDLKSTAFEPNGKIPAKYTCDGENVIPPLSFGNIPETTKSLALIMDDPDIPEEIKRSRGIKVFDHWVMFNIPPTVTEVLEGIVPEGISGNNGRGEAGYTGPCPPDGEHRYFFKLYALDSLLDLREGSTREEVEQAMEGHILDQAELIGLYERNQ